MKDLKALPESKISFYGSIAILSERRSGVAIIFTIFSFE
jgi:hypothetical protein